MSNKRKKSNKKKNNASNKVKKIVVKKKVSDNKIASREGHFFTAKSFDTIIDEDCDVYRIDENGEEKLLLSIRKNVIPTTVCCQAYVALEKQAKMRNNNRGAAAGIIDRKKLPKYVGKTVKRDKFRIRYIGKDGKEAKDHSGNVVASNIIGYYDRPDRNMFGKGKKYSKKIVPCRMTKFTRDNKDKWKQSLPLIIAADKQFKKLVPKHHRFQLNRARKTKKFQIEDTAFSTVTLNYNFRTALHRDKGDLEEGFGNLLILEKGKCMPGTDEYDGGYLGFPQYKVAVNVRQGDFLAMDVHEYHTNTPIKARIKGKDNFGRLSIVCYLRKDMIKCIE